MKESAAYPNNPWFTIFFRRGHLLALSILIVLVAGLSALNSLPRLEDPRIDTRNIVVLTPFPGAAPERVEALVSDVIEDELRQLFEIKEIKSTSRTGISFVNIELQAWTDNSTNQQIFAKIRDRLANAQQRFPAGVGEPELDEKRGATSFTLVMAMRAAPGSATPLSITSRLSADFADRLRNVPGTEIVRIYGEAEEEISVQIDPQVLSSAGLNIPQVSQIIAGSDPKIPAGVLRGAERNIRVQVAEELDTVDRIRNIPLRVSEQAAFLRLGDIAEVSKAWRDPPSDAALLNGQQVVLVAARMQATVRVDRWTGFAKQVIDDFNRVHQGTVAAEIIFEQNLYTESRLAELSQNLLLGCLVVMAVVLVFMGLRSAMIVGLSLPLCAAFAIFSLGFYDEQIHQMSIFGIIIAIGLLIDNAIVITDEIRSNLLDNQNSRVDALVKSIRHLFSPLLASTLTTILGFMPVFLLSGNIGDFISSIAVSVVMALVGSLLISFTIIAALAARFLPRPITSDKEHPGLVVEASHHSTMLTGPAKQPSQTLSHSIKVRLAWLKRGIQFPALASNYRDFLINAIKHPWLVISATLVLPIAGFVLVSQLGNVFFPSADRDQFEIYVWMPEGTSLQSTQQLALAMDTKIRANSELTQLSWLIGGSTPSVYYNQLMNRDNTPHFAHAVVTARSIASAAASMRQLQTLLDNDFPQAKAVVRAFGQGPPIAAPIGVEIYGPDLHVLNELGQQVRLVMSRVEGVSQSNASIAAGDAELVLNITRDTGLLAELALTNVASQLQASLDGVFGGSILEGSEELPVRIRIPDAQRGDLRELAALPLISSSLSAAAQWAPLAAVGDFALKPGFSGITRLNGERVNIVEGFLLPGVPAVDAGKVLQQELQQSGFDLPPGYRMRMSGDADEQQTALGSLATFAPVLLVLMITTLILTFSSVKLAAVIVSVAVLSVGLGLFSLWLSGLPVGFNPILGCAGLIGVAINGSIVVIAAINSNYLARQGDAGAIVDATMGCSRHILSTTFTTVGGFIPLLLFSEGSFWQPLAVVMAGGVGFSVMLSLVFTPLVVARLARWSRKTSDSNPSHLQPAAV